MEFTSNHRGVFCNKYRKMAAHHLPVFSRFLLLVSLLGGLIGCQSLLPAPTPTPLSTRVPTPTVGIIATSMLAPKVGIFTNVNGCLVILQPEANRSVTLVWPADSSVTIEADGAKVVTGLVTGNLKEQFLKFGELAWFGGGLLDEVSDDLKQTTAPHCPGPYWVVGFDLGPGEPPY